MFLAPWFAVAGLAAAAGPLIIHLLNRQRYRVVEWAAMDFLRQAVRRNRRIIRLRDLLLLAVRMLCVLALGLALARPYLKRSAVAVDPDQPVHAVLLVDNSLSMSYEQLDGTLLEEAKAEAEGLLERLPAGSPVSVLPLCGSATEFSRGAYRTKEDALEALRAIEPVDRAASAAAAVDMAMEACRRVPDLPTKQVVLLSDQQRTNWPSGTLAAQLARLPAPLQVVKVAPKDTQNAWIADFRLQDAIADLGTPAVFLATIRYQGHVPRYDVQVTLKVDGATIATQPVELQPGQSREVSFSLSADHFEEGFRSGDFGRHRRVMFVGAEVSIPHDRLAADDQRFLVVPVVAQLPVVFVDQYGRDEDPRRNLYGETYRLRRLLAPVTREKGVSGSGLEVRGGQPVVPQPNSEPLAPSPEPLAPSLIQVRHVKIDGVDRDLLKDARLVVIGGVSDPGAAVPLLRRYVQQGGNLVITAGGDFDPKAWTDAGWLSGLGILPAPLLAEPVGSLPGATSGKLEPFQLDFASMVDDYFLLEQTSTEELKDLYRLPYFFKAVVADLDAKVLDSPPRVLARFTNGVPFMIRRTIGRGQVLLVTSGIFRDWNTLTATNTVLIFDRIFRRMLRRTLPRRNMTTTGQLVLSTGAATRHDRFTLTDPDGREAWISVDALGADRYGITLRNITARGGYRVIARRAVDTPEDSPRTGLREILVAVNGPARESELDALDEEALGQRLGEANYRWVGREQSISIAGASAGQGFWKWLLLLVLLGLLVELAILAMPALTRGRTT